MDSITPMTELPTSATRCGSITQPNGCAPHAGATAALASTTTIRVHTLECIITGFLSLQRKAEQEPAIHVIVTLEQALALQMVAPLLQTLCHARQQANQRARNG